MSTRTCQAQIAECSNRTLAILPLVENRSDGVAVRRSEDCFRAAQPLNDWSSVKESPIN
jgi:hypothetical protein